MKHTLTLYALIWLLTGCTEIDMDNESQWRAQSQSCIDAGGVPIRSAWDGELKTCEWPPAHLVQHPEPVDEN